MGYLAKILVVATLFSVAFMLQSQQEAAMETSQRQSEDQEVLLARETAESGLRMAASKAQRDFDAWRTGYDQAALDGGNFDVDVQGTAAGPIQVIATGSFGGAQHQVEATLARLAPSPAALLIDADTVEVEFTGSDFVISGRDTRPGSAARARLAEGKGHSDHVNGVWARGMQARSAFIAAAGSEATRVRGQTSESDVAQGSGEDMEYFPVHLGQLFLDALTNSDEMYVGGVFNNQTFGSAGDPQVIVINGPSVFLGTTRGYGLLVVQGGIAMHDDFEWEGVVLARQEDDDMDVVLAGNARIYGALIARHGSTSGSGEEEGGEEGGFVCPSDGLIAKFEWDNGEFIFEIGSHPGAISISNVQHKEGEDDEPISADFSASVPINDVFVKAGTDTNTDNYGSAVTSGMFTGIDNKAISHVKFLCTESGEEGSEGGEGGAVGGSGTLRFVMRDNAAIYYSTEAIGKLAARMPIVKNASWIVKFDQIGEDLGHEQSESQGEEQ